MSLGDSLSHSPLLTSVSPPRFNEPRRKGLNLLDTGTLTQRTGGEKKAGNVAQEARGPGREGDFSFPGPTLGLKSSWEGGGGAAGDGMDTVVAASKAGQTALRQGTGIMTAETWGFSLPGSETPGVLLFCFQVLSQTLLHETNFGCVGWGTSFYPSSCLRGRDSPAQCPLFHASNSPLPVGHVTVPTHHLNGPTQSHCQQEQQFSTECT